MDGGKVYVFTQVGQGSPGNAWQFDANAPSTPLEVMTNGTVSCVMNGQLFWANSTTVSSCTFQNCVATTTPVVTLATTDEMTIYPTCDPAAGEIVWGTEPQTGSSIITIRRASATGANARAITTLVYPANGGFFDRGLTLNDTERRLFFQNADTSGNATVYYISTKTVNANSVPLATLSGSFDAVLANDSLVLADASITKPTTTNQIVSAPLPNGIASGAPPLFLSGRLYGGVIDATTFYGVLWTPVDSSGSSMPSDTIIRCPLTDCSSPAIVTRGQSTANYFADDATAVYWTTSGQTPALWKIAK